MLDPQAIDTLHTSIADAVITNSIDACQFALGLDGEVVASGTFGSAPPDARFLLFSSTKVLLPAVVWQLMGEGALDPDLPVTTWWPEFGRHGKAAVTLEHVMVHTAGLPNAQLSEAGTFDRATRVREIEDWALEWEPGSRYEYHGLSAHWILAELIERITGSDYRDAVRARLLDPLGLHRLELGVPVEHQGDIQPVVAIAGSPTPEEIEDFIGLRLDALPATPTAPTPNTLEITDLARPDLLAAGVPGANAVSDADDVAVLMQHLLHDPTGLWEPAALWDGTRNVRNTLPDFLGRPACRTLGLETMGDDEWADKRLGAGAMSPATFGHSGAGGQIALADPESGLSFVFLTNTLDANFVRAYTLGMRLTRLAARCVR